IKKNFNLTNIQEYQMAAGNENTHLEMVMPVIHYVPMHGLSHVIHEDIKENNDGIRFKVPVVKLDEFNDLLTNGERVTGLKIDVENYEYFVLTGAKKILQKHRPLIYCELWENDNRQKCFSFLNELGYSAWVLHK